MIPPVNLGVIVLLGFLTALALRPWLQRAFVLAAAEADQPQRQFVLDLALSLLVAAVVIPLNRIFLTVPLINGYAVFFHESIS